MEQHNRPKVEPPSRRTPVPPGTLILTNVVTWLVESWFPEYKSYAIPQGLYLLVLDEPRTLGGIFAERNELDEYLKVLNIREEKIGYLDMREIPWHCVMWTDGDHT
jgi:hypothetical protein